MTQTSIRDHFVEPDEEKQPGAVPTEFAEHYEEELEIKYNWNEETLPYAYLFKLYMYRLARDESRYKYLELPDEKFEFRKSQDVVDSFFHHGKPKCLYIGQYVEYWILYFATEGRYRCNHNKVLRRYKKARGNLSWTAWSAALKHSDARDWEKILQDDVYGHLVDITDQCNWILSSLMKRMRRTNIKTALRRCAFDNLQNLPEFVPFQQNRTHEHKQFRWYFEATKKGGNAGFNKTAKKLRLPKQSIHRMLKEFDEWLPALRWRQ